jgi:N-acetylglutamate synthase-like GNAT family acetyltransferase
MIVDQAIISCEPANNFPAIETFYASVGYAGFIAPNSVVIAARDGDAIVGAARIARENGILVLRGMMVAPSHQRSGLGTRMLWELDKRIGRSECFCLPHGWLQNFYGQIGFATIADDRSPSHLLERLNAGRIKYPQLVIMRRPEI